MGNNVQKCQPSLTRDSYFPGNPIEKSTSLQKTRLNSTESELKFLVQLGTNGKQEVAIIEQLTTQQTSSQKLSSLSLEIQSKLHRKRKLFTHLKKVNMIIPSAQRYLLPLCQLHISLTKQQKQDLESSGKFVLLLMFLVG